MLSDFHVIQRFDGTVPQYLSNPEDTPYARRFKKQMAAMLSTHVHMEHGEQRDELDPAGRTRAVYSAAKVQRDGDRETHQIAKEYDIFDIDESNAGAQEGVDVQVVQHGEAYHEVDLDQGNVEYAACRCRVHGGPNQNAAVLIDAFSEMRCSHAQGTTAEPNAVLDKLHVTRVSHSPNIVIDGKLLLVDTLLADAEERVAKMEGAEPEPHAQEEPLRPFTAIVQCYEGREPGTPAASVCFKNMTRWMRRSGVRGLDEVREVLRAPATRAPRSSVISALLHGAKEGVQGLLMELLEGKLSPEGPVYYADVSTVMYVLVDIKYPAAKLVELVRRMALGLHDPGPHAHATAPRPAHAAHNQRQALLMLGTLAHRLYREGSEGAALLLIDDLVDHIDAHLDSQWLDGVEDVHSVVCQSFRRHKCLHLNRTAAVLEQSYFPHSVFMRALENAGHPTILQHVQKVLNHPYQQMRAEAARTLRRVAHTADAAATLLHTFRNDESHGVRRMVVHVYRAHPQRRPPRAHMETFEEYLFTARAHPEIAKDIHALFEQHLTQSEMRTLRARHAEHKAQARQRAMEAQEVSAGGSDVEFKPAVIHIEGGIDERHGKTYGGKFFEAGWSIQVTDEVWPPPPAPAWPAWCRYATGMIPDRNVRHQTCH